MYDPYNLLANVITEIPVEERGVPEARFVCGSTLLSHIFTAAEYTSTSQ
jgi:hypothetical protein